MKRTVLKIILITAAVLSAVGCGRDTGSVGVIGGADGPTAVLITSNFDWVSICCLTAVIAAIVLLVLVICRRRRKK